MTPPYRKKLIEVAIPLEAINVASMHEKSVKQGHPSSLHQWWARRPLAACRAVLFAQLVDDPSAHPDQFPTQEDQEAERKRLFNIIEDLIKWDNSANQEVIERAQREIKRSCNGHLPEIYDPFSGAASIPLEAQRLGLPSYGSDLNPVAVMIGKAIVELPRLFNNLPPINPKINKDKLKKDLFSYKGAQGLANDVRYYGARVREMAEKFALRYYPEIDLPQEHGGGKAKVISWIWARTVETPNPAFKGAHVPLVKSFHISAKKGADRWVRAVVNKENKTYKFLVSEFEPDVDATMGRTSAKCILSGDAIPLEYIQAEGKKGRLGTRLMAVVTDGPRGRIYLSPRDEDEELAKSCPPVEILGASIDHWRSCTNCVVYGLTKFEDLFTRRQINTISVFSDCIRTLRGEIREDAISFYKNANLAKFSSAEEFASSYVNIISIYLAFALDKLADLNNSLCGWEPKAQCPRHLFGKQAIPMVWDFAEANPFSNSSGSWFTIIRGSANALEGSFSYINDNSAAKINYSDATEFPKTSDSVVICTDPPYYDNIPYSNLSDFFYIWLKRTVGDLFPELFSTLVVPRSAELVANQFRHGSKENAENFFLSGMQRAISQMVKNSSSEFPATIFYAFKQSEKTADGVSSKGWATFLKAVISSGYSVVGTWPIRTENSSRMMGQGNNALANSVVLVCRKKEAIAGAITRAEFIRALKRELPPSIAELQAANIAPADMPQSAIGPGMGVFSRYKAVLESDDSPMSVKVALQLINRELGEHLEGIQGEFDADTRFAITWFEQNGLKTGEYGIANNIATARGISVESVKHAGIVESQAGKVRILRRDELDDKWEPGTDQHLTIWECLQHLVRIHEKDGISYATTLLLKEIGDKAEAVKDLAYCLYDISANKRNDSKEATAYNALIADWTELSRQAAAIYDSRADGQQRLDL